MDVNVYFRKREINKKCILTTLLGWNMHAKLKILSFLISTAVYPLLYYVIAQRIGSYAGYGGMETAEDYPFTFYCILFLSFATWFILSTAAAQWLLRGGWIGFLALAAGILILQGTVVGKDKRASRDPQPYTEYDSNGNVQEQGNKVVGPFQKWLDKYQGILYLIPWIIGFVVFKAFPFGQSLYYSFTDMNFFKSGTQFVGLANYITAFTTTKITKALLITFKYAFITVPLKLVFALFIAYILNFKIACVNLFRTVYYIPSILGGSVAIAVLWKAVFSVDGLLNTVLRAVTFGLVQGPEWLSDPSYALWIICFLRIWQFGSAMVLFLAALKGVPADLYEAATIDGAGKWRQFFSITVPMITPIIFYNLVTQICQAFQEFNGPYIITNGGPRGSTTLISLLVYNYAFKSYDMGMASALAWIMFIIVCILTIIAFTSQKKWVYYSDER